MNGQTLTNFPLPRKQNIRINGDLRGVHFWIYFKISHEIWDKNPKCTPEMRADELLHCCYPFSALNARTTAALSSAPKIALPDTSRFAPASTQSGAVVSTLIPPSTER